ncbi:unnamed protein product [Penicillium bialowiezense]
MRRNEKCRLVEQHISSKGNEKYQNVSNSNEFLPPWGERFRLSFSSSLLHLTLHVSTSTILRQFPTSTSNASHLPMAEPSRPSRPSRPKKGDRSHNSRRPDVRSSEPRMWNLLGIDPKKYRARQPIIRFIKQVYAPLMNDFVATRDVEDAKNILRSASFRREFRVRCMENFDRLPESVKIHQPDRDMLFDHLYDVLRYLIYHEPSWRVHMKLPRGAVRSSKSDDKKPAAEPQSSKVVKTEMKSSSPAGPSATLLVSPRISVPPRVSPRLSLRGPAPPTSASPPDSRQSLRVVSATATLADAPASRPVSPPTSPLSGGTSAPPRPTVPSFDTPKKPRTKRSERKERQSETVIEAEPKSPRFTGEKETPRPPRPHVSFDTNPTIIPDGRRQVETPEESAADKASIPTEPPHAAERIEQELPHQLPPRPPRPSRPPRPIKGTPEWNAEYRKRVMQLRFFNRGCDYDLLDQDWVMDSDPADENYGLRDPALGPIFGPPEEPKYAEYPWQRDP